MISITLAGHPVAKGRPRFTRMGRAFTPEKTRSYESLLRYEASVVMGNRPPISGPVRLVLEAHVPIPQSWSQKKQAQARIGLIRPTTKPDADNMLKLAADSLNGIVWNDDKQIVEGSFTKLYSERPRLILTVSEINVYADDAQSGKC